MLWQRTGIGSSSKGKASVRPNFWSGPRWGDCRSLQWQIV